MPETVSLTYVGTHDAVNVPDLANPGSWHATDVEKGKSVDVPEDVAKSLLEQEDNWQRTETKTQREARVKAEKEAAEEKAAADKAAKEAIANVREARKENK